MDRKCVLLSFSRTFCHCLDSMIVLLTRCHDVLSALSQETISFASQPMEKVSGFSFVHRNDLSNCPRLSVLDLQGLIESAWFSLLALPFWQENVVLSNGVLLNYNS
uniref:Uncharacterized protein n=1 Tax=Salix viminalis TaxID=40686 RepID=A0A6N2NFK4_SALVM